MDLRNEDCLEEMKRIDDNSIDLLFCDLPYTNSKFGKATSCAWDKEIDLDLFWKQANRICRNDTPMIFTCSTKFGNCLINSNPKNFRQDICYIKSASVGFLNAKKRPLVRHEMVYIFYRKLPKVYGENIALHHKHKFIKKELGCEGSVYGKRDKSTNINQYEPALPNSIIREGDKGNIYNTENRKIPITRSQPNQYEPKLPCSIIRQTENYKNESELYGKIERKDYMRKNGESMYEPALPNSIIKEDDNLCNYDINKNVYGGGKEGRIKISKNKEDHQQKYEPALPCSVLEIKSQKGKHSTQKPVALMEWILKYYSKENDIVLDPTMGSGSMGVACKNMNRKFIGIEMDKDIYEIAFERLID